ncbi:MAG: hypothetical protein ACTIII_00870, partial [Brachybacterium alimentarium]
PHTDGLSPHPASHPRFVVPHSVTDPTLKSQDIAVGSVPAGTDPTAMSDLRERSDERLAQLKDELRAALGQA